MATSKNTAAIKTTKELKHGINGSGQALWVVQVTTTGGRRRRTYFLHKFTTEAEALNWMKWA